MLETFPGVGPAPQGLTGERGLRTHFQGPTVLTFWFCIQGTCVDIANVCFLCQGSLLLDNYVSSLTNKLEDSPWSLLSMTAVEISQL